VDVLDSGLDGASSFPNTNCVRKGDDVEGVVGSQVTKDHIHGILSLWGTDEVKEMGQDLRTVSYIVRLCLKKRKEGREKEKGKESSSGQQWSKRFKLCGLQSSESVCSLLPDPKTEDSMISGP
jgi:hypothetical protein